MPEKISVLEDLQIILVNSYGEVSASDLESSLDRVLALHAKHNIDRVLVDSTHGANYPDNFPLFEFGSNLATKAKRLKIAVAVSPSTRPAISLIKQVAANRGVIIEIFDSIESAISSLKE